MKRQTDQDTIRREKLIYRYVQGMDQGDVEEIAVVLDAALDDPELDRIITEIDLAYQEEENLMPTAHEAQFIRDLIQEHLPSAFKIEENEDRPLTVGEVAAQLKADRNVSEADKETNRLLLASSRSLPAWLSGKAIKKLAEELGVTASKHFWRTFKETAVLLNIGRTHSQAQLLAAREERAEYKYKKDTPSDSTSAKTSQQEEENQ